VKKVINEKHEIVTPILNPTITELLKYKSEKDSLLKLKQGKKEEEVPQEEKDLLKDVEAKISGLEEQKRKKLEEFGAGNELAKQLVDLALLANNMLRGEALNNFVKRSVEMIK
jgi:molecular chaperone HtpG